MPKQNILRRMAALARQTRSCEPTMHSSSPLPSERYIITVISTQEPTPHKLIGSYSWVDDLWCEYGPLHKLHESLRKITPPTGEVTVLVKKFDHATASEQAIEWAIERGYRLLFPWEREAFTKANPELQRSNWFVDLGSLVFGLHGPGFWQVPILHGTSISRFLGCAACFNEWDADLRFLFALKHPSPEPKDVSDV